MTSGDTHEKTVALLKKNNNFGMSDSQIVIMKQEKVATLINNRAEFGLKSKYELETKPHGHGDVHSLMYSTGTAEKWFKQGIKWLLFFQDTNGVTFRSLPSAMGVSVKNDFSMNSITVPRLAKQALGAITMLTHTSGDILTINVEYNQLGPLLLSTGDKKGDIADETGFSPYPGNCNVFIVKCDTYNRVLQKSQGAIPEFVNPKYKDEAKIDFNKPTRLECMMQELPKLFEKGDIAGMTQLPGWIAMKPVKNNIKDAKVKHESIGSADGAASGEAGIYYCNRQLLRASTKNATVEIEELKEETYGGIPVKTGAHIVLMPNFGISLPEIESKVKGKIKISANSTLIIDGKNIDIDGLDLDGTLIVTAKGDTKITLKNLIVKNQGWKFQEINPENQEIPERFRIRGYVLNKKEQKVVTFDDNQTHIVSQ